VCDGRGRERDRKSERERWGGELACRRRRKACGWERKDLEDKGKKEGKRKKKIKDTWRAVSGWKGMMKSYSTNQAMTRGKGEIILF
jgi:hypothetical protein